MIEGPVGKTPGEGGRGRRARFRQQDHHRERVPPASGKARQVDDVDPLAGISHPRAHGGPPVGDTQLEQSAAEGLGRRFGGHEHRHLGMGGCGPSGGHEGTSVRGHHGGVVPRHPQTGERQADR